jgi:hypothetical protein
MGRMFLNIKGRPALCLLAHQITQEHEMSEHGSELITISDLAREASLPVSWLYERSRFNVLPGQRRLGKYVRIDREEFYTALREGKIK